MKETGQVLNITESRVSQIHSQAIVRLRNKLRRANIIEH
jgi:DNA-directed RNA polymerase specialized sigma subunit